MGMDAMNPPHASLYTRPICWPGITLGVGLGGFADGIVLHQVAQWHQMLSSAVPPVTMDAMRTNMAADGWFHLVMLAVTVVGVYGLFGAAQHRPQMPRRGPFTGQLLLGWGAFNLVEGLVDHHLLGLHHVRDLPAHVPLYDWLFLGVAGVGFMLLGWSMGACAVDRTPRRLT